ncbi:MAG: hypothetical protein A2Y33_15570 [Spirochaetes bacterium GWF1_51_8]|nr:MAG: hypothetical protein A2Y33_15570 [Spirochaetes bacterium GWF1_51_8]
MRKGLVLFLIFAARALFAQGTDNPLILQDIQIKLGVSPELVFNRTLGAKSLAKAWVNVEWKDTVDFECGYGLDMTHGFTDAYYFGAGWKNIFGSGAGVTLKFLSDPAGEYGFAANSIIPYAEYRLCGFHIRLGVNFRFTVTGADIWNIFAYNTPIIEQLLYYSAGYKFSFFEGKYTLDLELANHERMFAGNFGNYGFYLKNAYAFDDKWNLSLDIGLINAGSIALSSVSYKLKIGLGVELIW